MRVVLATERPQTQNLLIDVIEGEPGAIVVGQAGNTTKALGLVKNLRPDVAIIDSDLPYSVGFDTAALSRINGLDTAQIICETIPGTHVIVITNLDTQVLPQHGLRRDGKAFFSRDRIGGNIALRLEELRHEVMVPNTPVFANVEAEPWPASEQKSNEVDSGATALGSVSIAGGLYLIGTLWLAPYGVLLVLAGVVTLFFGLLRKLTARLWPRRGRAG